MISTKVIILIQFICLRTCLHEHSVLQVGLQNIKYQTQCLNRVHLIVFNISVYAKRPYPPDHKLNWYDFTIRMLPITET